MLEEITSETLNLSMKETDGVNQKIQQKKIQKLKGAKNLLEKGVLINASFK